MNTRLPKLKKTAGVIALVVLLIPVVFYIVLWHFLDQNDYKSIIRNAFMHSTGMSLDIQGDVRFDTEDNFRLTAEQVRVNDKHDAQLLSAGELTLAFGFSDLLLGDWKVDELFLSDLELFLIKGKDGEFSFLSGDSDEASQQTSSGSFSVPFSKVTLSETSLTYIDELNHNKLKLNNLNAVIYAEDNKQSKLTLKFDYDLNQKYQGGISLSADFLIDQALQISNLKNEIKLNYGDVVYDVMIKGELSSNKDLSSIKATSIELSSETFELDSQISMTHKSDETTFQIEIDTLNLIPLIQWLTAQPVNIKSQNLLSINNSTVSLNLNSDKTTIGITALQLGDSQLQGEIIYQAELLSSKLKVDEIDLNNYFGLTGLLKPQQDQASTSSMHFDASLQINQLYFEEAIIEPFIIHLVKDSNELAVRGQLETKGIDPAGIINQLPVIEEELIGFTEKFQHFQGNVIFDIDPRAVSLTMDDVMINETTVNGDLNYQLDTAMIMTNLQIGNINLDRYHNQLEGNRPSSHSAENNIGDFIGQLKSLKGQGRIQIDSLNYQGVNYRGIDIRFDD